MPGNKKPKKKTNPVTDKPVLSQIVMTLHLDGDCNVQAAAVKNVMNLHCLQAGLQSMGKNKAFNDCCKSQAKQARLLINAFLRNRSWFYRNIVARFI